MPRVYLHDYRLAVFPDRRFHRQLVDVRFQVFLSLPAVAIESLPEVSLAIKQTDADHRNVQIGRAFDVIAGQYSKPAGVNGKRLMQAEFSREIRHRTRPQNPSVPRAP